MTIGLQGGLRRSEIVFQFQPEFGVLVVDGKGTVFGVKIIKAKDSMHLVIEGIVGTQAVEYTTIGDIDIGETLQRQVIVQQVFRYSEGGQSAVSVVTPSHS